MNFGLKSMATQEIKATFNQLNQQTVTLGSLTNKNSYCHVAIIVYVQITKILYTGSEFDEGRSLTQW